MTIYCFNIDYDVSSEELDFAEDCKEALVFPKTIEIDLDESDYAEFADDPSEYIANHISNETGWLVNSFEYELS